MAFNSSDNQAIIDTGLSSSSKGMPSNDALGNLFAGVGKALGGLVQAKDEKNLQDIEQAAYASVDETVNDNTPPALGEGIKSLQGLRNAKLQGKISETKFQSDVVLTTKRLRSQFGEGYAPMIDRAVSSAIGSSSANDLRKARIAEIQAASEEDNAELKNMREFMESPENAKLLTDPTVAAIFQKETNGGSVQDFAANPDPEKFSKLKWALAVRRGQEADMDLKVKQIETAKKITDYNANPIIDQFVSDSFNSKLTPKYGTLMDLAQKYSGPDAGDGDVNYSGAEGQEIAAAFNEFKIDAHQRLQATFAQNNISPEARAEFTTRLDNQLKSYEEALINKDMGKLYAAANVIRGNKDSALVKLFGTSDVMRQISIMKEAGMPDAMITQVYNSKIGTLNDVEDVFVKSGASGVMSGKTTFSQTVDSAAEADKNMPAVTSGVVQTISRAMNSPMSTPEDVAKVATNLFSPKNKDLLDRIATQDRAGALELLMSPVIVKKLQDSGNKDALIFAMNWGNQQFDSVTRRARDEIVNAQKNRTFATYSFDGEKFVISPRGMNKSERMTSLAPKEVETWLQGNAAAAVTDVNRYISIMKPLWDAQGIKPQDALSGLFMENVNTTEKNPTLLRSLGDALMGFVGGTPAQADTPGAGDKPGQSLDDGSAAEILGFVSKAEGADYSTLFGGSKVDLEGMTVGEVQSMQRRHGKATGSSATGAYQVMRRTLSDLIDNGTVDPDEKFTPEVQDRIGKALLDRRGYNEWKSGKLSTESFANRLAMEWASLPTSSGRSAYHGDKMGNKSTKSRDSLIAMLEGLKNG